MSRHAPAKPTALSNRIVTLTGAALTLTFLATAALAGPTNLVQNGNFLANGTLAAEAAASAAYNAAHGNQWPSGVSGTHAGASSVGGGWTFGGAGSFNYVIDLQTYNQQLYSPAPQFTNGTVAFWDNVDQHYSTFWTTPGEDQKNDKFAIASDPSHLNAPIAQLISGLVAGQHYDVTFEQASAQQYGYSGSFTGAWQVSLGGSTKSGVSMFNPSGGDTAWTLQTLDFIATGTSEMLSFLSTSNGGSSPPFLLLADISLAQVPEPGTLGLAAVSVLGLLAMRRRAQRA